MSQFWSLCYINRNFAYFTSISLSLQWGDDWDDAPYEQNAGQPYGDHRPAPEAPYVPHPILKVAFDGNMEPPFTAYEAGSYSVEDINIRKAVPWLQTYPYEDEEVLKIWAGDSLDTFISVVTKAGGNVYIPLGFKF